MAFKKITLTIPEKLYNESMKLIAAGYFANFSDLVRAGLRDEIKTYHPVLHDRWDGIISLENKDEELPDKITMD